MRLLTPLDLIDRFPEGERVVFVGNAPSLRGERLGKWIDSHDVIVRFNESSKNGYEDDVGIRTDILVSNPYPSERDAICLTDRGIVLVISPQTRRPPSPQLEPWVGRHPVLFTYTPDLVKVGNIEHLESLTTGVYGLHLLARLLRPSHVSIAGFTMYLEDTSHHYWNTQRPNGLHAHDVTIEASIFISVCNSMRCRVSVTDDIAWVARRVKISLRSGIQIHPLTDPKWQR